jgi:hypothetical protein
MDSKSNWSWLPAMMPGVARLMADKRKALGNAHVNECWRRGVVLGEPGWLFAWEGSIAIGRTTDTELLTLFAGISAANRHPIMLVLANPPSNPGAGQ